MYYLPIKTFILFIHTLLSINPNGARGLIQHALFSNVHFFMKKWCWRSQIS